MNEIKLPINNRKTIKLKLENPVIEITPKLENLEITPSKEEQTFKSDNYYGYDEVKVNCVTNEIDTNIKPENIKEGIEILGVKGEYVCGYDVQVEDSILIFNNGALVEKGEMII